MKQRCNDPHAINFKFYGDKGITYHKNWVKFENFLLDMGERPGKEFSLDRVDSTKGYYKENCQWILKIDNSRKSGLNNKFNLLRNSCRSE